MAGSYSFTDTLDDLVKISNIKPIASSQLSTIAKQGVIAKFMKCKAENPDLSQKDICRKLDISESTLRRTRKDLGVSSFYRYDVSDTSELQKSKSKWLAVVRDLEKRNLISVDDSNGVRNMISNNTLDSDTKQRLEALHSMKNQVQVKELKSKPTRGRPRKTQVTNTNAALLDDVRAGKSFPVFNYRNNEETNGEIETGSREFIHNATNEPNEKSNLQAFLADRDKPIQEKYNIDKMMQSTSQNITSSFKI